MQQASSQNARSGWHCAAALQGKGLILHVRRKGNMSISGWKSAPVMFKKAIAVELSRIRGKEICLQYFRRQDVYKLLT
eukprot:907636-Pelagomonas_calceolata.AAC.5